MDLQYTPAYQAYRSELRGFLRQHWRQEWNKAPDAAERMALFRTQAIGAGYLYRNIPQAYGGSEQPADVLKGQLIREEWAHARAPGEVPGNGVTMLVPTLLEWGTPQQKDFFIPQTIRGEILWAQGYSEPGAGSDLASLKTRAVLDSTEWVITGQKIWTTLAMKARYMFALVRTEPSVPRHRGISYLLLDLKQPAVTVRPLKQINGESEFCEVFLDGARAPGDWLVGERGKGWEVSRSTLKHERNLVGGASTLDDLYVKLVTLARSTIRNGRPLIADPAIADRLLAIEGYVKAHLYSSFLQLTRDSKGESAGTIGLMNKLNATEIGHWIAQLVVEILGPDAMLFPQKGARGPERWLNQVFGSLGLAIAGGTSNIQRNIIAERGLGLPRDSGDGLKDERCNSI
jgi:alkylation response protein AidB-like acyl-CoA dehydrogenase